MAPKFGVESLEKRQFGYGYCNGFNNGYNCGNSGWNDWGRWVALGCIIAFAILVAVLFSCYSARRRRSHGLHPYYGTGWAVGNKPAQYQNNQGYYGNSAGPPAPPYSPGPVNQNETGNTFNRADGYYGGQQQGIELQQPQSAYQPGRGGEPVYEPPQGPPPGKGGY